VKRILGELIPLIVTDVYEFYERVVREVFGPACLYGQVLKTRRNDRIIKVERRQIIGAPWSFEWALSDSEDSSTLNTSFIERLDDHLELIRCYYNFMRKHRALKFGREVRTPAIGGADKEAVDLSGHLHVSPCFLFASPTLNASRGNNVVIGGLSHTG